MHISPHMDIPVQHFACLTLFCILTLTCLHFMDINRQSTAYYRVETFIDIPPSEVYEVVACLDRWHEWQSGVRVIRGNGKLQEGDLFKWNNAGMQITSRLTNLRAGEYLGWQSRAMWIKAAIFWEFEPAGDGCRVIYEQSIEGFGSGLLKTALTNSMETTLLELKKYCENELVVA